jgi:antitoxin VapB
MALNIKNPEVERLAQDVARLAKESKTEAIRRALEERRARLRVRQTVASKRSRLETLLKDRIWPEIPRRALGHRLSKREEERILGYGPDGV